MIIFGSICLLIGGVLVGRGIQDLRIARLKKKKIQLEQEQAYYRKILNYNNVSRNNVKRVR